MTLFGSMLKWKCSIYLLRRGDRRGSQAGDSSEPSTRASHGAELDVRRSLLCLPLVLLALMDALLLPRRLRSVHWRRRDAGDDDLLGGHASAWARRGQRGNDFGPKKSIAFWIILDHFGLISAQNTDKHLLNLLPRVALHVEPSLQRKSEPQMCDTGRCGSCEEPRLREDG